MSRVRVRLSSTVAILATAFLVASGCSATVTLTEQDIFTPLETSRRLPTASLKINDEEKLAGRADIQHGRVKTEFGTMAVTHAVTGAEVTIVRCGGNMADRVTDGAAYIGSLLPLGDVMIFDYPGYGDSEGEPRLDDILVAADAMADLARTTVPRGRRVAWGHSAGGFVCAAMAGRNPGVFDAVVLEATAPSLDAAIDAWVPSWIDALVEVEASRHLADLTIPRSLAQHDGPVLVLTAGRDTQISPKLGYQLYEELMRDGHDVTHHYFPLSTHGRIAEEDEFLPRVRAFLGGVNAPRIARAHRRD